MTTAQLENLGSTKRKINITVPKDKVDSHFQRAYQKVSESAQIKGFRPGKIPQNILDKHYGPQIDYECLNFIISESYSEALKDNKLFPMTEPKFDTSPIIRGADYKYSVELEVRPEFELKEYKGIEIKKKTADITTEELDAELKKLQESLAQLAPADEDAVIDKGTVTTIDFDGLMDGAPFDGGNAKDHVFEFGAGQFLESFEKPLAGLKKGAAKTIDMEFPADYFEKKLAAKKASFNIVVKNLHKKVLPALDDELAKDIGKENLEQVKSEIKNSLGRRQEQNFRHEYADFVRKHLAQVHQFEVPQTLVDDELARGKREKQEIINQLKLELILDKIAENEGIQATQKDVDQYINMLSQMYRQPVAEIKKLYSKNNMIMRLVAQIVLDKTLDFIIQNAKMTE